MDLQNLIKTIKVYRISSSEYRIMLPFIFGCESSAFCTVRMERSLVICL